MNDIRNDKIDAFAGHRYEWHSIGVEEKLPQVLEELIQKGYTIFYDGNYGAFDKKYLSAVLELKHKYPHIKIFRILTYYHSEKEKYELPSCYDGSTQRVDNRQLRHSCLPHRRNLQKWCLPHTQICSKAKQTNNLHLTKKKALISLLLLSQL